MSGHENVVPVLADASRFKTAMLLKIATSFAVLSAVFIYRSGRVAWNHILTLPDLPDAYYAGGNWTSHCSLIEDPSSNDINFCEDITFWDHRDVDGALTDRLVLFGCDPNRKAWNTVMGPLRDPNPRGHLFLYVPSTDTVHRVTLQGYPAAHDFHPLGMDIYPSHDHSPSNLFIVNHARAHTTIEQFILDPARPTEAQYVRTLHLPAFVSPNALTLTGPTSFFVSNDHLFTRRLPALGHVLPIVESIAGLPLSWVAHVAVRDDTLAHTVAALGIPFANGVALHGNHLAVASTTLGVVYLYTVDGGKLALAHTVPVPFFPDNVAYDDDGVLIVTGHPHFPALVDVAANKTRVGPKATANSPSWAVALTPTKGQGKGAYDTRAPLSASQFVPAVESYAVETLFQSDGSVFGSSSTTLRDAQTGAIYMAGLYEQGVLVCRP